MWLAQVGRERIEETLDPELIVDRLVATYERKGYTREWINQRLQAIHVRNELTAEWKDRGVQGKEFAYLTDELTRAWSGMTTRQYKDHKGLKKESLRDNMSTTELTLNQLAEVPTKELSQQEQPVGFDANKKVAQAGGSIAGNARRELEERLGKPIITSKNATQLNHVVTQMIEASVAASNTISDDEEKINNTVKSFEYSYFSWDTVFSTGLDILIGTSISYFSRPMTTSLFNRRRTAWKTIFTYRIAARTW